MIGQARNSAPSYRLGVRAGHGRYGEVAVEHVVRRCVDHSWPPSMMSAVLMKTRGPTRKNPYG